MGKTTDKLAELRAREAALPKKGNAETLETINHDLEMVETLCRLRKFHSCGLWLQNAELLIEKLEET